MHLEDTNEVAYTPSVLQILQQLANVSRDTKAALQNEEQKLARQTPVWQLSPEYHTETEAGVPLAKISSTTSLEKAKMLSVVTDAGRGRSVRRQTPVSTKETPCRRICLSPPCK